MILILCESCGDRPVLKKQIITTVISYKLHSSWFTQANIHMMLTPIIFSES